MDWRAECAAVVPCLNEAVAIGALVEGIHKHVATVLVVDDGSTDATASMAQAAGAEVLRHDTTRGKGAALRTGWSCALERGFKRALTMDGDGQHLPDDIPAFFENAQRTSAALIVGNRMAEATAMPWARRWVNRWMSRRLSAAAGLPLPDSQCGFRLMKLSAWAQLGITTTHFEIESELLLAFVRAGLGVQFVPVRAIYKDEQSKIHPVRDAVRWVRWWRAESSKSQVSSLKSQVPSPESQSAGHGPQSRNQ
jgi:glycosyltransferase involved in cell wall biosynthesis